MVRYAVLMFWIALWIALPLPAGAEELAIVRGRDGSVVTGHIQQRGPALVVTRLDGSEATFADGDVLSVEVLSVPGEALPAALAPVAPVTPVAAVAPAVPAVRVVPATPSGFVPRTPHVVRATVPSPPPPALRGVTRAPVTFVPVEANAAARTVEQAVAADCKSCGDTSPSSPWHFRGGLALGLGDGNSDFFDLRLDGEVEREPTPWGFKVAFTYVYGTKEGDVNANNWRAIGRVERKFSAKGYAFGQILYERDPLADLTYRWTFTVGAGWTVVDGSKDKLDLEAGLGGTLEKRTSEAETFDPSGWLGADWEHCFDECRKLKVSYSFRPNFNTFDLSASTFSIRYLTPCFKYFNLEVALRLNHVINPPDDIEPLDVLFTVGLKFEM